MFGNLDKFSLPEFEKAVTKFWEEQEIFQKTLEKTKKGKPYSFYDGPPFATGLPHYGHILASTIKDVIPRYQTMRGRFVRRRWGWDCHGLPIEEIVERKLGISGKKEIEEKVGIAKFNETCREMVLQYVAEWRKMIRRMGRWIDFDNSYKTMDKDYMESVWWAFKELYKKGLVYEGRKVLLYCPRCETPVSNFEVAMDNSYKDVTEEAVTVKFKVKKGQQIGDWEVPENTYFLAWTTTPWTLPGNIALAVGKDIEYAMVKYENSVPILVKGKNGKELEITQGIYILAKDIFWKSANSSDAGIGSYAVNALLEKSSVETTSDLVAFAKDRGRFFKKYGIEGVKGDKLLDLEYEPLFEVEGIAGHPKAHKVYAADFVTTDEGTGIVHTAVVYGEDDYNLGLKEGLPVVPMLDERGHFNEKAPEFLRGVYFKKADSLVKKDLDERGLLFGREIHEHSYPHCWRCGNELFYNAIPAWFVKVEKIKKDLLKSNKKEINWYPEHLKLGRYAKSVESAPDWNISRNRYWGNPIPVWRCEECGKDIVVGSVKELGVALKDLHRPGIDSVTLKCRRSDPAVQALMSPQARRDGSSDPKGCGGKARRVPEIFDSWMEAGSMPFSEYHYPFDTAQKKIFTSRYPAQFVAEYIAQTRAWFYVMHVLGLSLFGKAPFQNVVTTGTILAEDGSKMSKSKNNFPDPWIVIEKYGVDALRFYLMNSVVMQGENLNFSVKDLEVAHRKVVLILWNCFQYLRMYGAEAGWKVGMKGERAKGSDALLDLWISARTKELVYTVTKGLDSYDTVRATRAILEYVQDLSTWYVRRSRRRTDSSFFETLQNALLTTSKVIAPFMPHLAEVMYKNLVGLFGGDDTLSVHLAAWPKAGAVSSKDKELLREMDVVRDLASKALAKRAEKGIRVRQPLAKLKIQDTRYKIQPQNELLEILKDEVNVREIVFSKDLKDEVELDTEITHELWEEGMLRELQRTIQGLRQDAKLHPKDQILLGIDGADEVLSIVKRHEDVLKKGVGAKRVEYARFKYDAELETKIESYSVRIGLRRV